MTHDFEVGTLYNAARSYCIERTEELFGDEHGDAVIDVQARSAGGHLLNAILTDIERSLPEDFAEEREVRDYLLSCGTNARVHNARTEGKGAEWRRVYEEPRWTEAQRLGLENARAEYVSYVTELTIEQAALVDEVPYRHVISSTTRRGVLKSLEEHWDVNLPGCWHPLLGGQMPPDVIAFQDAWFYEEVGAEQLQSILLGRGITRVWEITEIGLEPEYELDTRLCDFTYPPEKYWSSRELDWLVYVSHESSITFAGDWLINRIKEVWPNWQDRIYRGWEYERPLDA